MNQKELIEKINKAANIISKKAMFFYIYYN